MLMLLLVLFNGTHANPETHINCSEILETFSQNFSELLSSQNFPPDTSRKNLPCLTNITVFKQLNKCFPANITSLVESLFNKNNLKYSTNSSMKICEYNTANTLKKEHNADSETLWIPFITNQIVIPFISTLIMCVGVVGNSMVIYVIVTKAQMQNVVNLLLLNLAIADIAFVVIIPPSTAYVLAKEMLVNVLFFQFLSFISIHINELI